MRSVSMTALSLLLAHALSPVIWPQPAAASQLEAYSGDEATALDAVVDFDLWRTDSGLTVLLRRAGLLAEQTEQDWPPLDRPDYHNLLQFPARYRGLPVRMTVLPGYLKRLGPQEVSSTGEASPGADGVWRLDCFDAGGAEPADQPVRILLVVDPSDVLDSAEPLEPGEETACAVGRPVEIAALFYKVYTDTSRGDPTSAPAERDYPVLVAWHIGHAGSAPIPGRPPVPGWAVLTLVLLLAAAYTALRVYTKARSGRSVACCGRLARSGSLDADLQAAAKQYRATKQDDESQEDNS